LRYRVGILLCVATMLPTAITLAWGQSAAPSTQTQLGLTLGLAAMLSMAVYGWPSLYIVRTGLLALPGLVSGSVLLLPDISSISPHALLFQTRQMGATITLLTSLALGASGAAWGLGCLTARPPAPAPPREFRVRFVAYLILAVTAATWTAHSAGPLIWTAAYVTQKQRLPLGLGSIPAMIALGILGMLAFACFDPRGTSRHRWLVLPVAIYACVYCLWLRGERIETLGTLTGGYFMWLLYRRRPVRPLFLAAGAVLIFAFSVSWGNYRIQATGGTPFLTSIVSSWEDLIIETDDGLVSVQASTFGDIAATLLSMIGLVDEGELTLVHGKTYLDFILRTPPQFLYPDRPETVAWIFWRHDTSTGGGLYELAEAYYNFGPAGAALVPAIISFLFARVYMRAIRLRTPLAVLALGLLIATSYRGIWYQTFNYYRMATIWLTFEAVLIVFTEFKRHAAAATPLPEPEHPEPAPGPASTGGG